MHFNGTFLLADFDLNYNLLMMNFLFLVQKIAFCKSVGRRKLVFVSEALGFMRKPNDTRWGNLIDSFPEK